MAGTVLKVICTLLLLVHDQDNDAYYDTLSSPSHFSVGPQMAIQDGLAKTGSHTHPTLVGSTFSP